MDKTCNGSGNCTYRTTGNFGYGCNYKDICEYQRPKVSDSYTFTKDSVDTIKICDLLEKILNELKQIDMK